MNNIQLHQLNDYHLSRTGGLKGLPLNNHRIFHIAVTLKDSVLFGEDWYPTIIDKAVFLVCNLIQGHCFQDANKRTGISAMLLYLLTNGYRLATAEGELETLALKIANRQVDSGEVKRWLLDHAQESTPPYTWEEAWEVLDDYHDTWERLAKQ